MFFVIDIMIQFPLLSFLLYSLPVIRFSKPEMPGKHNVPMFLSRYKSFNLAVSSISKSDITISDIIIYYFPLCISLSIPLFYCPPSTSMRNKGVGLHKKLRGYLYLIFAYPDIFSTVYQSKSFFSTPAIPQQPTKPPFPMCVMNYGRTK